MHIFIINVICEDICFVSCGLKLIHNLMVECINELLVYQEHVVNQMYVRVLQAGQEVDVEQVWRM